MPSRNDTPPTGPPSLDVDDLPRLLRAAQPASLQEMVADPRGCEKRRIEAVEALLLLARATLKPLENEYPPAEVLQFLQTAGVRILLADDPVKELRRWLGSPGRGRRAKDERLDMAISTRFWRYRLRGRMTVKDASAAVAKEIAQEANIDATRVRDISYKYGDEGLLSNLTPEDIEGAGS
jgi:hypothetical protein